MDFEELLNNTLWNDRRLTIFHRWAVHYVATRNLWRDAYCKDNRLVPDVQLKELTPLFKVKRKDTSLEFLRGKTIYHVDNPSGLYKVKDIQGYKVVATYKRKTYHIDPVPCSWRIHDVKLNN